MKVNINGIVFSGSHEDIEWAVSRFAPDMPAAPTQSAGQRQTDTATVKDNPDPHLREFQELEERFLYKHGGGEAGIALSDIPPVPFPDHDGSTCVKQHGQLDA